MRVTLLNQFYAPDVAATAHLAASLAEHRAQCGDQVTVITSRGGYVSESTPNVQPTRENLKIYRIWTPQFGKSNVFKRMVDYLTFFSSAIWRAITLPRQDVFICLTTPPFILLAGVFHKLLHRRTKLVLWSMDLYPDIAERMGVISKHGLASCFFRWLNRKLLKHVDHVVCLDTAMRELIQSQYTSETHLPSFSVIPNWERADFFSRDLQPDSWSKRKDLCLDDRFVILYLGNAGYGHQFETVIDAAKTLCDEPVVFLFVGGGQQWAWLEQAKQTHRLDNVILHEYVDKETTPSIMKSADCALITMRDSSLGVISPSKLHSNLAMSLPVIYVGPKQSNVDDALENFHCGVSLRHGDSQRLVDFIRRLMNDSELLQAEKEKARGAFEQAYCDTKTLAQFDRLFALFSPAETEKNATS